MYHMQYLHIDVIFVNYLSLFHIPSTKSEASDFVLSVYLCC